MNGIDLIAIVAVILIVAMLARLVQGDIRRARSVNSEVLRESRIKASEDMLREVDREADTFLDKRSQDAIHSAVWAIRQREHTRAAAGAIMNSEFGEKA